jgi:hypothetical protein
MGCRLCFRFQEPGTKITIKLKIKKYSRCAGFFILVGWILVLLLRALFPHERIYD